MTNLQYRDRVLPIWERQGKANRLIHQRQLRVHLCRLTQYQNPHDQTRAWL
jgi:hypothetical protein